MKILILGGTSFFGREFAIQAHKAGHEVTVFSRRCPTNGLPLDIKQVRGDRSVHVDIIRMSVDFWDVIIDNICYSPKDAESAVKAFDGRVGQYIFTSSEFVYSALDGASSPYRERHTEIFKENSSLRENEDYQYAFNKLDAENIFLSAFKEKKFPISIIRFPVVIGPNDPTLRAFSYWVRLSDGKPLLLPGAIFSRRYIYSKDAARAFETLISAKNTEGETYNFGDNQTINLDDFIKLSANIMTKKADIIYPEFDWLKENSFNFESSPFTTLTDFNLDISKVQKAFDWKSTDINIWLKETINWFFFKYTGSLPKNYALRKEELLLAEKLTNKSI
ncbi:MAG: NAD-dependent epimerase/dehydratase family protein [Elusimicrobiota bacterium]|nr:NAD-dependent epimerase/dehydratase family protein [Elusimicrobiota bacterium]